MIFVESPVFTEDLADHMTDERYREFQLFLAMNPDAGDVIQGTNGLRKIRWPAGGKVNRGGARVIYYYVCSASQIRLILIYRKGVKDDLSSDERKILCDINRGWN